MKNILSITCCCFILVLGSCGEATPKLPLTIDENLRMGEIVNAVIASKEPMDPSLKTEFWAIIQNHKINPDNEFWGQFHEADRQLYFAAFWEDALVSVKTGKAYQSKRQEQYESVMIKKGIIAEPLIQEYHNAMKNNAAHKSVSAEKNVLMDEATIKSLVLKSTLTSLRICRLFEKPQ